MGRKLWGSVPFWGELVPISDTMSLGPRPTSLPNGILVHPAIWPQQIWAENWRAVLLLGEGGAASPSITMWPGCRSTRMPSFILIHPTVWPQYTNVTDRTDRQDRTDNDSIGRTALQTVVKNDS